VQPALGFEHRRSRFINLVIVSGLVFVLLLGLLQFLSYSATHKASSSVTVMAPAVTVQYVTAQPVAEQMPALPASNVSARQIVTIASGEGFVNVRSGPGVGYDKLGALTDGFVAPVTGRSFDGQWWQINFNGRSGWVYGQLAQFYGDVAQVPVVAKP
jgi:uncharacterized protein YraI